MSLTILHLLACNLKLKLKACSWGKNPVWFQHFRSSAGRTTRTFLAIARKNVWWSLYQQHCLFLLQLVERTMRWHVGLFRVLLLMMYLLLFNLQLLYPKLLVMSQLEKWRKQSVECRYHMIANMSSDCNKLEAYYGSWHRKGIRKGSAI